MLSVIGVYPPAMRTSPTGEATSKNLTVRMGNCDHRRYVPLLVDLVKNGAVNPDEDSDAARAGDERARRL